MSFRIITYKYFFYNFRVTIAATNELLCFIGTQAFINEYGELFLILQKLNQDFVESFFFLVSKANVWRNTKYDSLCIWLQCEWLHNLSGYQGLDQQKKTNVYELEECMSYFNEKQQLPQRLSKDGIFDMVEWFVDI